MAIYYSTPYSAPGPLLNLTDLPALKVSPRSPPIGPRRSLLVVDDEESIRDVLTQYLEYRHYHVKAVASANEAVLSLDHERFDLAIVDLVMPGIDGLDLLDMIRSEHPHLPVVIFTGVGFDNEILLQAREKGASGFLSKGLPLGQLLMEVHRLLNYQE